jgi:hypothetical protein
MPGAERQILLAAVTLSIVLGLGIYGVARASEPLFPGLMSTEGHEVQEGEHGHVEPTMDMTMPAP